MANNAKKIYGVIGYPVKHSLSPVMHNAAFAHLQINAEYKLFEVRPKELEDFLNIDNLNKENIYGLNVTIPHKIRAKEILEKEYLHNQNVPRVWDVDLLDVELSGAINTIKRESHILKYWNTDVAGFKNSLYEDLGFKTEHKTALLIGCGGAGRAIIAALSSKDFKIKRVYITDINQDAIVSAKKHFDNIPPVKYLIKYVNEKLKFIPIEDIEEVIKDCDLLVNATPIGMKDEDEPPIKRNLLHENLFVYDVVYNRDNQDGKTRLIRDAESLNLRAAGGLRMLLHQGVLSFEHWIEKKAPQEIMWKALQENLTNARNNN